MNIIVTGGAGFIGSNLIERLVKEPNVNVLSLDNYSNSEAGSLDYIKSNNLHSCYADCVQLNTMVDAIDKWGKKPDYIVHLAAMNSVPLSMEQPGRSFDNNVLATFNVVMLAKRFEIKKIIYTSSSSVYGDGGVLLSPYAINKATAEGMLNHYCGLYGIRLLTFRPFNIFGPRQKVGPIIPRLLQAAFTGEHIQLYGNTSRDYTYVGFAVENIIAGLTYGTAGTYDIGFRQSTTLIQLAEYIGQVTGKPVNYIKCAGRPGDIQKSQANNTIIYAKNTKLTPYLKTTYDYYLKEWIK